MSKFLSISLVIISFITGIGVGYILTPEYSLGKSEQNGMISTNQRYRDIDFLNGTIAHHELAIDIAKQAKANSKREEIKNLAESVISNEPQAIAELYKYKKEWFNDSIIVKRLPVPNLGSYDEKFDLRFLNAMIAHHKEAIDMSKSVQTKSSRKEVIETTDTIITNLSKGVETMSGWRKDWYGV